MTVSPSSSIVSVLRIGSAPDSDSDSDSNSTSTLLKTALCHYFQSSSSSFLTLKNKYFTAKVCLQDLGSELPPPADDGTSGCCCYKEDGVLLLFDALQCNPDLHNGRSFDELEPVHDAHVAGAGELLRVCIGISLGDWTPQELRGSDDEAEYSKRILWCLDRGYEYLEMDLSQEGQLSGHDQRDKEGFARLIEAMQGTVWSSAVMQQRKRTTTAREEEGETKPEIDASSDAASTDHISSYEPPNPDMMTVTASPLPMEENEYLVDDDDTTKNDVPPLREEQQEARDFDELERLMKEATRIRDMSKSGSFQSDDERRQRAADAASLMMNLMGNMGLEDDDDDSSTDN